MTLHIRALAGATAVAAMLLYVFGAMLEVISPWGAAAFVSLIFHLDVIGLALPFTGASFIVGISTFAFLGAAFGAFVAWGYNTLARRSIAPAAAPAVTR